MFCTQLRPNRENVDTEHWTQVTRRKPKPASSGSAPGKKAKPSPQQPVFHLWRDPTLPQHVGSYKAVSDELQQGKSPSAKVVEVNEPQADELRNLWQAHDIKNASITLAFVNCEAPAHAKKQWLHVTAGGAPPTVKLIPCLVLGGQTCQLPAVKVTQAQAPATAEAAVLRVTLDKQYVADEDWKKAMLKPANAFHAMTEKKGLSKQIIATYGWRILSAARCTDQVTGFLKVNSSAKDLFLHASGIDGFFIDTLAKHGPKANVDWITPLVDEPRAEYRARVLSEAEGQGVALRQGHGAALGVRTPTRPNDTPKAANWQLDGVPKSWSLENVCGLLTENKWTDVAPVSKPQGNRGWIVRATAPDTALCHVFELSNTSIMLHLAAHRGPKRLQKPIARAGCDIRPAVSKWSKAVGGTVAHAKTAEAPPPNSPMQVEKDDNNTEEMDTSGQNSKRSNETTGTSPEKKKARAACSDFDKPFGFQRFDCGGNGDCGYRAAAAAYALSDGRDLKETRENAATLGATLRAQVASHLKKHQLWKDSWTPDPRWTEATEGGTVPTTYDEWLESTARPGRWVCGPTLIGIATRLKRNLVVFTFTDGHWEKADLVTPVQSNAKDMSTAASFPALPLFLKDKHYFTLEPQEDGWPAAWSTPTDKNGILTFTVAVAKAYEAGSRPALPVLPANSRPTRPWPKSAVKFEKLASAFQLSKKPCTSCREKLEKLAAAVKLFYICQKLFSCH